MGKGWRSIGRIGGDSGDGIHDDDGVGRGGRLGEEGSDSPSDAGKKLLSPQSSRHRYHHHHQAIMGVRAFLCQLHVFGA